MKKDPTEFRDRFARWKAGEKVYEAGKISDRLYYDTMERVAELNNAEWNKERRSEGSPELSVDEEFTRILNDNTYDYRGYYNKYPGGKGNAIDHWTDEFKTVYHPTFSVYSKYSGKKSLYNPEGILGGRWDGERYIPAWGLKLPKYGGGKPGSRRRYDYKYVQAGKDNEWERITDDEMSDAFLDFVARPKSRGGNTDTYNWNKQWALKGEPGLEIVSPEFDLLSLGVGGLKELKHLKQFKRVIKNTNTSGDQLRYDLYNWKGIQKGRINVHTYDNMPEVGYVESKIPGGSRALYDAVIKDVTDRGMPGLYSGRDLLSAPKTYSVWKHYKDKLLIGRYGNHNNLRMPGVDGSVSFSGDYNKMLLNWKNNVADGFYNGEVYLLKTPSQKVMSSPYLPRIDNLMTGIGNPIAGHLFTNTQNELRNK